MGALTEQERFMRHVMPEPNSGCWIWMGARRGSDYGVFYSKPGNAAAHRYSYELANGPIPEGLVIDHLCRVHCCVNPDHLEAVTNRVNSLRGIGFCAKNASKTHCDRGHELTGDNVRNTPKKNAPGWRDCRACRAIRIEKLTQQRRAARGLPEMKKKAKPNGRVETYACLECQRDFKGLAYQRNAGNALYCSVSCKNVHISRQRKMQKEKT